MEKCKTGYVKQGKRCVRKRSVDRVPKTNNYSYIIYTIIGIMALGAFIYGGTHDWFKGNLSVINNQDIDTFLNQNPTSPSQCSLDLNPNSIYAGDRTTGIVVDGANTHCYVIANDGTGWVIVYEGDTDADGFLVDTRNVDSVGVWTFRAICDSNHNGDMDTSDCITNKETLNVIARPDDSDDPDDAPDTPEVGDNVGSGSAGGGNGNFGDDIETSITMPWTTGGPYVLGAKITRSWDYVDNECIGPEQYPMEWTLYDSNGMAWQKYDYLPVHNIVDTVCPVTYHEDAPWKFVVSVGIQACEVTYNWNVQPYICEVS